MKHAWFGLIALALTVAGCSDSPLHGGSRLSEGVYWRLNMLGEGERTPTDSDSVYVRVRMAAPDALPGSWYSTEQWYPMGEGRSTSPYFGRLRQGDSATVLLRSSKAPWVELGAPIPPMISDTSWVQMELSIREIRSLQESRERAHAALMARTEADEDRILTDFLAASELPWKQSMGIWYVLDPPAVKGPRVQSSELVTMAYAASFLDNGQTFDEQPAKEGGLTFRLGDPGQVIKGLEAAAHLLPEKGGSGRFIIPSELAFGPKGSSSGIIPPWTPVLYEITVLPQPTDQASKPR